MPEFHPKDTHYQFGGRLATTGKTLIDESDEIVEQAHHRVGEFCNTHQYQTSQSQLGTPQQGRKQQKMLIHQHLM